MGGGCVGVGGWVLCLCGLCVWFEVCGLWCGGGGWWVVVVLGVSVVCVDFELYPNMIDLCGKHSQV